MADETSVILTKLEVAASLGAVRAVEKFFPGSPRPEPLRTAAEKFDRALEELTKGGADA